MHHHNHSITKEKLARCMLAVKCPLATPAPYNAALFCIFNLFIMLCLRILVLLKSHFTTRRFRTRNGLGISSVSGSHIGGGVLSLFFSAIRAAKALPLGSGLLVPSDTSTGLPPALAWASSTSVRPRGARLPVPPLFAFAILFFTAILFKSSPEFPFFPFVKLFFRVGDNGTFS
jgi:hypothetical protein